MTSTRLLRSRVKGNFHARFCSRAGVATSRLRQLRPGPATRSRRLMLNVNWLSFNLNFPLMSESGPYDKVSANQSEEVRYR